MVRDKCETLMSIFLSWLQFMIACLKLCPTWWTFKRRLRNRGHFLNTYNKNVFQPSLCTAAPSPQKKKKTEKVNRSFERGKKNWNQYYLFLFICLFITVYRPVKRPALPPPPPGRPPGISFFFALDDCWGPLSCQISWGGDEKRGQIPRPPSTLQRFSLIAQSSSAMGFFVSINVFLCNSATV